MLQEHLRSSDKHILEVGSGTGQHAVYFGKHLADLYWQTSDVLMNHEGIQMWLDEAELSHVLAPAEYQIGQSSWPDFDADVVFSANTLHIISTELVQHFISDLGKNLYTGNRFFYYGPFKYNGDFTSPSNAEFERWLKNIDSQRGIRDFECIVELMQAQRFTLLHDLSMPANNQLLIFEKL